jgi:hypothetical protein
MRIFVSKSIYGRGGGGETGQTLNCPNGWVQSISWSKDIFGTAAAMHTQGDGGAAAELLLDQAHCSVPLRLLCRYIEPAAAVPLNNDLGAARGELAAAEEAVLWRLTGRVAGAILALESTLDRVRWGWASWTRVGLHLRPPVWEGRISRLPVELEPGSVWMRADACVLMPCDLLDRGVQVVWLDLVLAQGAVRPMD